MSQDYRVQVLQTSSEESFQFECSPCKRDGNTIQATIFCLQCKDYLCLSCEKYHESFHATKTHKLVSGEQIPEDFHEAQSFCTSRIMCQCDRNELEMYCRDHNKIICSDCKTIRHRQCQISMLDEYTLEAKQDTDGAISQKANEIKEKITTLKYRRKQDLEKLAFETRNCKEDIASIREEINQYLDKIEEKTLNDLDEIRNKHEAIVKQHIVTCNTAMRELSFHFDNFEKARTSADQRLKHITNHKLRETFRDIDSVLESMNSEVSEPKVSVERNRTLSESLKTGIFGVLNHNLQGCSKRFTSDMKPTLISDINIRMESDRMLPWISGSTILTNGDIVLVDRTNDSLKILEPTFKQKSSVSLSGKPRDCCGINDTEVLVTLSNKKLIQWFHTSPLIKLQKSMKLDKACEGIDTLGQEIFVTCHEDPDKEIRVLDRDGNTKRIISLNENGPKNFKKPYYITVASTGEIYVSEIADDSCSQVRCFAENGICRYIFIDSELKAAVGNFLSSDGYSLVCYSRSDAICLVKSDGTRNTDLFLTSDAIKQPYSICFRESDATLFVTMRDSNKVIVCKMKYNQAIAI